MTEAVAANRIRAIIERVERIEADEAALREDKKEIYAEAKGDGLDVKALKAIVRRRKQDRAKRQEEEAIMDLYLSALGEV